MKSFIKNNRKKIDDELSQTKWWKLFSPVIYNQFALVLPAIKKYVNGDLLDIGCGKMPYKDEISKYVSRYDGLDISPRTSNVKYICSVEKMDIVPSEAYDSAIALEVLEHLPHPWIALHEVHRIMKPNGVLIISVPHLSRLHEEPHDYYRYTKYGLRKLLEDSGFDVINISEKGGLFCFLGHQISSLLVPIFWSIPVINYLTLFLNGVFITGISILLDKLTNNQVLFPQGYLVVARKSVAT